MDTQVMGTELSKKASLCEVDLMRICLQKVNQLAAGATDEQVRERYTQIRLEQERQARESKAIKVAEQRAALEDAVMEPMRRRLRREHVDPAGMDETTMRARMAELDDRQRKMEAEMENAALASRERRRAEEFFGKAMCPPRHVRNLDRINETQHPKWRKYRDEIIEEVKYANGYLIALLGSRGTGKTQLGVSAIHKVCSAGFTCRYAKMMDVFRDLRRAYTPTARGQGGDSEDDLVKVWTTSDLLVIDEAHERGETRWENATLTNLLDLRYDAEKCTVLIANQDRRQFAESVGESIVSRIHETGTTMECNWSSFREPGKWMHTDASPIRPHALTRSDRWQAGY